MRILGTYHSNTGEIVTISYDSPNFWVERSTSAGTTAERIGAGRPVATGIEVFSPSTSGFLGTLITPNSTFDEITIEWKRLGPTYSQVVYRR